MTVRLRRLLEWIRARFTHGRPDDDLDEEIADYLARAVERKISNGVKGDEALRLARAELGSPAVIRDHLRDASRGALFATLWQDVRYGVRLMRRSRGFTLVAALVLSLGIGVTTALFSIVNALYFTPLPVKAPEELVYLYMHRPTGRATSVGREEFKVFARLGMELADFTSHAFQTASVSVDGETQVMSGERIDGEYFQLLGVGTTIGRPLGPSDADPATTEPAVVISHDLWLRRFRGDPRVLGRQIRIGRAGAKTFTIVGVAAEGFRGLSDPWTPSQFWITSASVGGEDAVTYPIARLKNGTTLDRFQAFLATATATLQNLARDKAFGRVRLPPRMIDEMRVVVFSASDVRLPSDPRAEVVPTGMLTALSGVVALVLLITTANVAGLLLARGVIRRGELAIRQALGGGASRLTRQLLTEAVLLSAAGGLLGLGFAWLLLATFRVTTPSTFALAVPLDWRVLLFAGGVCVGAAMVVGLAPAIQAARINVLETLGRGAAGTRDTRSRLRHWIVMPQVALTLILLVVAGVHVRALTRVEWLDYGYATAGGLVFRIGMWDPVSPRERLQMPFDVRTFASGPEAMFASTVLDRVREIPAVDSAGLTNVLPFRGVANWPYRVIGAGSSERVEASQTRVSGGYFGAMRIRVLSGRTFDSRDTRTAATPVVISHSLARGLWPTSEAVGKAIAFERDFRSTRPPDWFTVIGVVDDVVPVIGSSTDRAQMYLFALRSDERQIPMFFLGGTGLLVVRTTGDHGAVVQQVKNAVIGADAFAEVSSVQTTEGVLGEILYPRRVSAGILVAAGLVGLMLAALGLYGLLSYSVAQRQREIGIRATLGAGPRDLIGLVLREGGRVIAIGGGVGLVVAAVAVRLTAGLVPGLPHVDMIALIIVPLLLAAVVLAACFIPARRASRIDPIAALREG